MIETAETLIWAMVVFATSLGVDGKEVITHSTPNFHLTQDKCKADGEHLLSVIDVEPGVKVQFACIPRELLRKDLALYPPADSQQ
jgi:hypothetical protein